MVKSIDKQSYKPKVNIKRASFNTLAWEDKSKFRVCFTSGCRLCLLIQTMPLLGIES